MTIQKLDDFAENGDKNLNGIDTQQGFIQAEKPARQWFNSLFNSTIKKVNEVITALEELVISTDKIVDGAVTLVKIDPNIKILGNMIAKDADLDTPKLSATYALTTLDAPNINLAADGMLKRSNDPLNAASRKVGTAAGNLVERDANGYPTNNNALGVGQAWQDMTASRSLNVTYTNTTGRPIVINPIIEGAGNNTRYLTITVSGIAVGYAITYGGGNRSSCPIVVPAGASYSASPNVNDATISYVRWSELR